ncbi:MAG: NAD(P)-binding domain-containing protein [Alphaproteobacteria bacterium]|nr:NAD(P)-binding domain-containing protein [Alphaproteobacteria bacterium]MCB9793622.1 NAD(P)-binding domain-containing protein [Alphaproteobacteria bacterium]
MRVSILGTGNMARGIATRFIAAGQSPLLHGLSEEAAAELAASLGGGSPASLDEALSADLIVLATPYAVSLQLAAQLAPRLAGKILVDISNPMSADYSELATAPGSSAAEEIAAAAPGARVVKAFNTTFAGTLVSGAVQAQPLDVFLASDDAEAKATLASLVEAGGLVATDVGPLRRARQLEGLALLGITLQFSLGTQFGTAWKLVRP